MKHEQKSRVKQIEAKQKINFDEFLKPYPKCFTQYMKYCRQLEFDKKPDYKYIKSLFEETQIQLGYDPADSSKLSWVTLKEKILNEKLAKEEQDRLLLQNEKKKEKDQAKQKSFQ